MKSYGGNSANATRAILNIDGYALSLWSCQDGPTKPLAVRRFCQAQVGVKLTQIPPPLRSRSNHL